LAESQEATMKSALASGVDYVPLDSGEGTLTH
jgi:hypothetical protein